MKSEFEKVGARWIIRKLRKRPGRPGWYAAVRDKRLGKTTWFSTGETAKREAKRAVHDWIAEQEAKEKITVIPGVKFPDAFEEYLATKTVRKSSEKCYKWDFDGVYKPAFGDKLVAEIESGDIELFMKGRKKQSARNRKKHLSALRSFFKWCKLKKYVEENPCEGLKVPAGEEREPIELDYEEAKRLIKATREKVVVEITDAKDSRRRPDWIQRPKPPNHLFLAVLLSLYTGLRRRNILDMTWRNVDPRKNVIKFTPQEMKAKKAHTVPIHPVLRSVLETELKSKDFDPDRPVIGKKLGYLRDSFKSACERAELSDEMTWHCMRHTFATWINREGATWPVLVCLMAHSTKRAVTLKYVKPSLDELRAAVERLPDLLQKDSAEESAKDNVVSIP